MQLKADFPRDGSTETPPHPSADFQWKDYCPTAFGKLREVFNIEAAKYMESICGAPSHCDLTCHARLLMPGVEEHSPKPLAGYARSATLMMASVQSMSVLYIGSHPSLHVICFC